MPNKQMVCLVSPSRRLGIGAKRNSPGGIMYKEDTALDKALMVLSLIALIALIWLSMAI